MSFKLTIGRKAILALPSYSNEAICALIPRDSDALTSEYLYHALSNIRFDLELDQAVKGQTLNKEKINRLRLLLPSTLEQKRIAEVLDLVEIEIADFKEVRNQLQTQKRGLMQQLLTGQVRVG